MIVFGIFPRNSIKKLNMEEIEKCRQELSALSADNKPKKYQISEFTDK
jgi:hypothetical protein